MKNFKKMSRFLIPLLLICLLLSACGSEEETTAAEESESTTAAVLPTAEPGESETPQDEEEYDYSARLDEKGFWKGVTALSHVVLPDDYPEIHIPADVYTVSDERLEEEIAWIAESLVQENHITDRPVIDGDKVNIDYVGSVDGVEFEGGNTHGQGTDVTIGVTSYIDDFLEQLIGHEPGETINVEVTFPEVYPNNPDLAGKDAVFVTTINYIVETVQLELTDEVVKEQLHDQYGWSTVEEMKTAIRESLKKQSIQGYLRKYLSENSQVATIPESLILFQQESMLAYYRLYAKQYGMDLDAFLVTVAGFESREALLAEYKQENEDAAKYCLIVQAIAEEQGMEVTDEDIAAFFDEQIGNTDYSTYEADFGLPYLKMNVLNDMVTKFLEEKAVLD